MAPEHDAARAAVVERFALQGLIAGHSFRTLVAQAMRPPPDGLNAKRAEVEDAIRLAEQSIREEMASHSQRDMATSYQRLVAAARKAHAELQNLRSEGFVLVNAKGKVLGRDARGYASAVARLTQSVVQVEERLAKFRGWDEPERMHVLVTTGKDRATNAFASMSEEDLVKLAAEDMDRERQFEAMRSALALPVRSYVVEGGGQ